MVGLDGLWLPILLSAVFVFIASSVIHMVLSAWHQSDYSKLANEDKVMDALRPLALPAGDYFIPRPRTRRKCVHRSFAKRCKRVRCCWSP